MQAQKQQELQDQVDNYFKKIYSVRKVNRSPLVQMNERIAMIDNRMPIETNYYTTINNNLLGNPL